MVELSKMGKLRVLVVGVLLVKLALLLSFYHPVLWPASPPASAAQPTAHASSSPLQAATATSTPPPEASSPASPEMPVGDSAWEPVKQLAASLEQQRAALASKEAQLRQEQERLALLQTTLREQLEELATMRLHVNEALKKQADAEEEDLKRLARVYEAATPERSSALLGRLDAKFAARIIARMNGPKAGRILSTMEPAQAARVSEHLAKKE